MDWLHITTILLSTASFSSFAWAILRLFTYPEGKTPAAWRLSAAASICALVQMVSLWLFIGGMRCMVETAIGFYVAALLLFWWAVRITLTQPLSFAFSVDRPQHLVSNGPYRWIRHPFYTSYLLAWSAGVLATQQWWLFISVVVMGWLYRSAAQSEEEKFAVSHLADAYNDYKAKTGFFLPRI